MVLNIKICAIYSDASSKRYSLMHVALSLTFQTASSKSTLEGLRQLRSQKRRAPAQIPLTQVLSSFAAALRKVLTRTARVALD
jgi:hypothetical protein